jgi:lipopolysaccharide/colanic/teichoic acid biosynthesis glycosyltransferase
MRADRSEAGPGVTTGRDARVTRIGGLLRRFRLDELPQLWNVAMGQMRLVGPRPEDPRYVDFDRPLHCEVFTEPPGIAGLTQLVYADEGRLLDATADPDGYYREEILPRKVAIDAAYLRNRSVKLDLWILAQTPRALLGREIHLPEKVEDSIEASTDA